MAKYRFRATLSKHGIDNLINQLENYQNKFEYKVQFFTQRLAEYGIQVAKMKLGVLEDVGNTSYLIGFSTKTEIEDGRVVTVLCAYDTNKVINTWINKEGFQSAEISPLLMSEFGSGWKAIDNFGVGLGQGTFPGQEHAFDRPGWYWQTEDGKWHFSSGLQPQMPIYTACIEMQRMYKQIAREVFG